MNISFFGHSSFISTPEIEKRFLRILEENTAGREATLYFGGYGNFDEFALASAKKIKAKNGARHIFVTPYITESYQKNHLSYIRESYDEILYPPIESVPYRFAISARNKWLVENSDLIICCINRTFGGAYAAFQHARRCGKEIINIGTIE